MTVNNSDPAFSDRSLVQQLQSKKPGERDQAWEFVYKTYYPIIRDSICRNSGNKDDATDIFQDGLLILHRNLDNGTFRGDASIKTYIFSICRNLWLKELKKRKQYDNLEAEIDPALDPHAMQNYFINVEIVGLLLNELKEDCRKILIEYYFNNRSMAELKEMFNVNSVQAAKNKKFRCMSYLIKICKERRIVPTLRG